MSQHGKGSLKNFTEVATESATENMLATAGSNIKSALKH